MTDEIILPLTKVELSELAKMVYLAQFAVECCNDIYPDKIPFDSVQRKVFKLCVNYIPEKKHAEANENDPLVYTHTMEMEDECRPIIDALNDEIYNEELISYFAHKEFSEKYKGLTSDSIFSDRAIYNAWEDIYFKYEKEILENGLEKFRFVGD